LDKIIVNYWQLLSEKPSRLRRKEETSLYKRILCGYLPFKMFAKSIGSKQKRERRMCERLSLRDADVRCTPTCRISLSFVFRQRFTYSTKSYFTLYTTFLPLYIQLLYIQLSQVLVYWSYRSYRSAQELKADTLPAHALGASPRAWRLSALTPNF